MKSKARKALWIMTQVTEQGAEDLLTVLMKTEYKDHRAKSREGPDRDILSRDKEEPEVGVTTMGRKG